MANQTTHARPQRRSGARRKSRQKASGPNKAGSRGTGRGGNGHAKAAIKGAIAEPRAALKGAVAKPRAALEGAVVEPAERTARSVKGRAAKLASSVRGVIRKDLQSVKSGAQRATEVAAGMAGETQEKLQAAALSVASAVKSNPAPIALTGAGLIWLAMSLRSSRSGAGEADEGSTRRAIGRVRRGTRSTAARVRKTATDVADEAGEVAHRAEAGVIGLTRSAAQSARELIAGAGAQGKRLNEAFEHALRENPVPIGAAALALGAIAAYALPGTAIENQWMGRHRDELLRKARDLAVGSAQKVGSAARQIEEVVTDS